MDPILPPSPIPLPRRYEEEPPPHDPDLEEALFMEVEIRERVTLIFLKDPDYIGAYWEKGASGIYHGEVISGIEKGDRAMFTGKTQEEMVEEMKKSLSDYHLLSSSLLERPHRILLD